MLAGSLWLGVCVASFLISGPSNLRIGERDMVGMFAQKFFFLCFYSLFLLHIAVWKILQDNNSQKGPGLPIKRYLATSGDILDCYNENGSLLASGR